MVESNKQSIEIIHQDLLKDNQTLSIWIAEEPEILMPFLNKFAFELVLSFFPNYHKIHQDIYVKVKDFLLEEDLRNIRHKHLSKMVKIKGVVTRRSAVFSQLKKIYMECRCGNSIGPIF